MRPSFPPRSSFQAALFLVLLLACPALTEAHFLFVKIGEFAEGGRSAEVFFSEQAKAGDPRFIPKIAHTKLWIQTKPGEFRELKVQAGADRLRAILPAGESIGIVGECRYGVLSRPKQPPFLLRHYPKAVTGKSEEINRLSRRTETPFEIVSTIEHAASTTNGGQIRLVALRDGKPMPNAVFHSVDTDLVEVKFTASADGSATWIPPKDDRYCFYVADTLKESGELDGKHYDEVKDFATLTIDWPVDGKKAEPEAAELFKKAVGNRAQWLDFPGFCAEIGGELDGRAYSGKLTVDANGQVDLDVDDDAAEPWLTEQIRSLVTHRLPVPANSETKYRFGDEDGDHPLGRLVVVDGGRMASSYRVQDGEIRVVNRDFGGQTMTLSVLANQLNAEKRQLPGNYVVSYWDGESGRLTRAESFQDQWVRLQAWDLPKSHAVTTSSDGGYSVKVIHLTGHTLLKKP